MQLYPPITALAWLVIVTLTLSALCLLAGISRQTLYDPNHATAFFFLAVAITLHGIFVSGATTFGPVRELDVGADPAFGNTVYLYTDAWKTIYEQKQRIESQLELVSEFPDTPNEFQRQLYESCIEFCLEHNKRVFPVHVQVSAWDSRIYTMTLRHVNPPVTMGSPAKVSVVAFLELFIGAGTFWLAIRIWKGARRRGVRRKDYDPFALIRQSGG